MEITKEVLEYRISGMMGQLASLLEQAALTRGGLAQCKELLEMLEAPELEGTPEPKEPPEPGPDETPKPPESDDGESPDDDFRRAATAFE